VGLSTGVVGRCVELPLNSYDAVASSTTPPVHAKIGKPTCQSFNAYSFWPWSDEYDDNDFLKRNSR
jgi:hypothetical protein